MAKALKKKDVKKATKKAVSKAGVKKKNAKSVIKKANKKNIFLQNIHIKLLFFNLFYLKYVKFSFINNSSIISIKSFISK